MYLLFKNIYVFLNFPYFLAVPKHLAHGPVFHYALKTGNGAAQKDLQDKMISVTSFLT